MDASSGSVVEYVPEEALVVDGSVGILVEACREGALGTGTGKFIRPGVSFVEGGQDGIG